MKAKKGSLSRLNRPTYGDYIIAFIIFILALSCLLPFMHVLAISLSSNAPVMARQVNLFPIGLTFNAYTSVFRDGQMTYALWYTVRMTVIFTIIGMFVTICAAYPLSIKGLRGRTMFAFIFMFTMLFGAGLIPDFLLFRDLGLINTMWVLILPPAFAPFNILIMRTYFQSTIPESLYEAAELDGSGRIRTLISIVLPLSKPILATIALFFAVGRWNAFGDAMFFVTDRALMPLQLILRNMILAEGHEQMRLHEATMVHTTPDVLQAAMIMFATIPIVMVYPFIQKYLIKGVMIGAVKG